MRGVKFRACSAPHQAIAPLSASGSPPTPPGCQSAVRLRSESLQNSLAVVLELNRAISASDIAYGPASLKR